MKKEKLVVQEEDYKPIMEQIFRIMENQVKDGKEDRLATIHTYAAVAQFKLILEDTLREQGYFLVTGFEPAITK